MTPVSKFKKTAKQIEAINIMTSYLEVLLEGGSRSGKSYIVLYALIVRSLKYEGSNHLVVRKHLNHAKASIYNQTIPDVLKKSFPEIEVKYNNTEYFIEFNNKSRIYITGSDDKERTEKILGTQWDSIFLNEVSQISYQIYELYKTRLNPQNGIKPLLILDQNPGNRTSWVYKKFHEKINPETGQKLSDSIIAKQAVIKMNPDSNVENLSKTYLETLQGMSESMQQRFLYGNYSDDSQYALWKRDWIIQNRILLNSPLDKIENIVKLNRVIIAVDPAVTGKETSDDTGIIVAGEFYKDTNKHYIILNDLTYHGDVHGWASIVCNAYRDYKADRVVAEVNQGGDLVEANLKNYDRMIAYTGVRATRGKALRAEPIADLYRRGFVHHLGIHQELEDELCSWLPGEGDSPNRLDAVVWAITFLMGQGVGKVTQLTGW